MGVSMNKDDFELTLINQYREEIEEILVESEHVYRSTIDYEILDLKVNELLKSAVVDGLSEKIIWELLTKRIPSYVNYKNYKSSYKKVA
jgi:hypothetical protein